MKASTLGVILAVIASLSAGIWVGIYSQKPTIDELAERNNALAARDQVTKVQLTEAADAYERISFEYANAAKLFHAVADSMRIEIRDLANHIKEQDREIEFLSSINARLEWELETALDNVSVSGDTVKAEIREVTNYESGYISTQGTVEIDMKQLSGAAKLTHEIEMNPAIALSRDDAGVAICDVSFGDMPVTVYDIVCMNNLDPEIPTREKISVPQVGIGVGIGAAAILLLAAIL